METDSEVIEFIAGRRSAYVVRSGPFPFAGAFDVEPERTGSRVTATFEATPTGIFRCSARSSSGSPLDSSHSTSNR
jgi:hypothetical protein